MFCFSSVYPFLCNVIFPRRFVLIIIFQVTCTFSSKNSVNCFANPTGFVDTAVTTVDFSSEEGRDLPLSVPTSAEMVTKTD